MILAVRRASLILMNQFRTLACPRLKNWYANGDSMSGLSSDVRFLMLFEWQKDPTVWKGGKVSSKPYVTRCSRILSDARDPTFFLI